MSHGLKNLCRHLNVADRCNECDRETLERLQLQAGGDPQRMDEGDARFTIKDSGERKQFASGMVRDVTVGKIGWHKVTDGPMFKRWAEHLTKGAQKYPDVAPGVANWTLAAGEEEKARFRESAFRHFIQWYFGDMDEDHAAAVFFNINGFEYVKGRMQPTLEELNKRMLAK